MRLVLCSICFRALKGKGVGKQVHVDPRIPSAMDARDGVRPPTHSERHCIIGRGWLQSSATRRQVRNPMHCGQDSDASQTAFR